MLPDIVPVLSGFAFILWLLVEGIDAAYKEFIKCNGRYKILLLVVLIFVVLLWCFDVYCILWWYDQEGLINIFK